MNAEIPPTHEQTTLNDLVVTRGSEGAVVVVAGDRAGAAAKAMLRATAHMEGRMLCVGVFGEGSADLVATRRHPDRVTRSRFVDYARREGFADYVSLASGDPTLLADLFAPGTVDLVCVARSGGYDALRDCALAWLPALRDGGTICGTGLVAPGAGANYLDVLAGSKPEKRGADARFGVTRAVLELFPEAAIVGNLWYAQKGGQQNKVARIAVRMRDARRRIERESALVRSGLADAIKIGRDAPDHSTRIAMLEQIARDFPEYVDVHLMLGAEYIDLGLVGRAIEVYERPLAHGSGNAEVYAKLGLAHKLDGDAGAAEAYLLASLRMDKTLVSSWLTLASLRIEQGAPDEASDCVAQALGVVPPVLDTVSVLARLSVALDDRDNLARSLELLRRLDPEHELVASIGARLERAPASVPC